MGEAPVPVRRWGIRTAGSSGRALVLAPLVRLQLTERAPADGGGIASDSAGSRRQKENGRRIRLSARPPEPPAQRPGLLTSGSNRKMSI